ncbi:MAG: anaerobic ribonucleoside-triphosphate reductase activating protein [Desulfobacteraceae bacterium]|nr:anaerobic ribonucleoside-triphosphate reductase activating protein [Desulfobacteraceae bacterium]
MNIGGFIPSSLIDYPGKVACLVFTRGCNFRCPYCHNPDLVSVGQPGNDQNPDSVLAFLENRRGLLDAVVVSGGEPTLQKNLVGFLRRVKRMGFLVKLDTNGSRPQVLRVLAVEGLVDYIAMDIKTDPRRYVPDLAEACTPEILFASMDVIMNSGIDYEFRTTCVKPFIDHGIIRQIALCIKGAKRYALQTFRAKELLDPAFFKEQHPGFDHEIMNEFHMLSLDCVEECLIR